MEAMVIYDTTGRVWLISYGTTEQPVGVPSVIITIPYGAYLISIDPETGTPIYGYTADYYADQVRHGSLTILDVPIEFRTDTRILLKDEG